MLIEAFVTEKFPWKLQVCAVEHPLPPSRREILLLSPFHRRRNRAEKRKGFPSAMEKNGSGPRLSPVRTLTHWLHSWELQGLNGHSQRWKFCRWVTEECCQWLFCKVRLGRVCSELWLHYNSTDLGVLLPPREGNLGCLVALVSALPLQVAVPHQGPCLETACQPKMGWELWADPVRFLYGQRYHPSFFVYVTKDLISPV